MLSVEQVVNKKLPNLKKTPWLEKSATWFLRHLLHEKDIQQFANRLPPLDGIDFVEHVLDYFNFSYSYHTAVVCVAIIWGLADLYVSIKVQSYRIQGLGYAIYIYPTFSLDYIGLSHVDFGWQTEITKANSVWRHRSDFDYVNYGNINRIEILHSITTCDLFIFTSLLL